MAASASFTGFKKNPGSSRLDIYYKGLLIGTASATSFGAAGTVTSAGLVSTTTITAGTSVTATTTLEATTTLTAGTGLTVTTGNYTQTASDHAVTAGNVRLGVVSPFATTEPTSAYVMKVGTNAAGAIATSGGIFVTTGGATISKIIADGTVSQIEA